MALNRSDKSRILRRYFPGMTRNSEMSTEPSHHVPVSPPPLVLDRSVRRPCRHHSAGHADAAAVSAEAFAEAGGAGRGVYPVGQRLPGEGEHWRGCVGSIQSRTRPLTVSRSNREAVDRMLNQKGLRPLPPAMMPTASVMWMKSMSSAMSTTSARNQSPLLPRWPRGIVKIPVACHLRSLL